MPQMAPMPWTLLEVMLLLTFLLFMSVTYFTRGFNASVQPTFDQHSAKVWQW